MHSSLFRFITPASFTLTQIPPPETSTVGSAKRGRTTRLSLTALLALIIGLCGTTGSAQTPPRNSVASTDNITHLQNFPVIEFRRYPIAPGERAQFAKYFDYYFPMAFEQSGAIAFGQFIERRDYNFTWMRGFHSIDDRAVDNAAFYYGPVWQEVRTQINTMLPGVDDNVLLLHPLRPDTAIPVLPIVDPVREPHGATGVVVAQIFAVKKNKVDAFAQRAESVFASYRTTGAHQAGILVTLDVPNNFPQLPYRTDGPYLVWLGILKDNRTLHDRFEPAEKAVLPQLSATGLLRKPPELLILDPTHYSRLRWLPQWSH
ncbi:MAG: hypothetical protein WCC11_10465 [Gammaproteobacteria bacterium]